MARPAFLSPIGLGAGVVTAAIGLAIGDLPGAVVGAVAGWGTASAVRAALPRRGRARREPIDPFRLNDPWRRFVQQSIKAQRRYQGALDNARSGPLRERLVEIGSRVDTAVDECWRVAKQGQALSTARSQMRYREAERDLERLTGPASTPPSPSASPTGPPTSTPPAGSPPSTAAEPAGTGRSPESDDVLRRRIDALEAQVASARRLGQTITVTADRLRVLDARLDETVVRALELSVGAGDVAELAGLVDEVDGVVGDLKALRLGLEEAGEAEGPSAS